MRLSVIEFNRKYTKLTKFDILVNETTYLFTSIRDSNSFTGCAKILEVPEGWGGWILRADSRKSRGEGVIRQIPFVGVVWLFSGTTQLQKELSIAFYPDLHVFVFFEIAEVYSCLAGCRVYEGHLQNERVIKTFQKHPKRSKFVCIDSSLQFTFL